MLLASKNHVILEGDYLSPKNCIRLLKSGKSIRFSYFGKEFDNFQQLKDLRGINITLKEDYILITVKNGGELDDI